MMLSSLKTNVRYLLEGMAPIEWVARLIKPVKGDNPSARDLLTEIKSILDRSLPQKGVPGFGGNILIESFFEHPGCNYNNFLVTKLVTTFSGTGTPYVLTLDRHNPSIYFWKTLGFSHFVYLYDYFTWGHRLKTLWPALKAFFKCHYDKHVGFNIEIEGTEIGDLIYDDILRKRNIPSVRNRTFLLFSAIYNAHLRYFAYKKINSDLDIRNIVSSHDTYSNCGLLFKAASQQVACWGWFGTVPFAINRSFGNRAYIRKPRHTEKEHVVKLLANGGDWINRNFENMMTAELDGKYIKGFDEAYVYQDIKVADTAAFQANYGKFLRPKKKNVVVMCHVFIDAVNYSHWRIFSDYFTWLEETLWALARNESINIIVKPHPAEPHYKLNVTSRDLAERVAKETNRPICFLDQKVSNEVLYKLADVFVTAAGTIAAQAPCLGIPVVVAASSFIEEAEAIVQPKTPEQYFEALDHIHELGRLDKEVVLRARAAYLYLQRGSYSDTYLNSFSDPNPDADPNLAFTRILERLKSAPSLIDDDLVKNFERTFIREKKNQFFNVEYCVFEKSSYNFQPEPKTL